jgi:hypothetical protein
MAALPKTIYRDAGKPDAAGLVTNGCALPGAAVREDVSASLIPITDIAPEIWAAADWRSDATGFYD